MVTYLDWACISMLAPDISADLSLTRMQMSFVFSAFAVAYAAFGIPTARAGRPSRRTEALTCIVVWWLTFAVATAAAFSWVSLLIVQFLFGMGEAGAWPSAAKTFSRWVPRCERGVVQGVFFTGRTWPPA